MNLTLHIWRQRSTNEKGGFETYSVTANEHMSFLEMLDVLNQELIDAKKFRLHLSMIAVKVFVVHAAW